MATLVDYEVTAPDGTEYFSELLKDASNPEVLYPEFL